MSTVTPQHAADHTVNPELIKMARAAWRGFPGLQKAAFVPGGDPAAGGGAPPGGDPAAGGGAPPMDPSAGGGGAPPAMDPAAMGGGGGGGADPAMMAKLDQMMQLMQQGGGGGGAGGAGAAGPGIKPKIDVNVALMQLSKMVARIADAVGVQIPASEMVATPDDLAGMANKQQQSGMAGGPGAGGAGGPPPGGIGGIQPMPGMEAGPGAMPSGGGKAAADRASRVTGGRAYSHTGLEETMNKAAAIARLRKARR